MARTTAAESFVASYSEAIWQHCTKCQALTLAQQANAGPCPAGGLHDYTGSRTYLVVAQKSGISGQENWLWCNQCQVPERAWSW
jgi:hypothetical protein